MIVREAREEEKPSIEAVTIAAYEQYATVKSEANWKRYREGIIHTLSEKNRFERIIAEIDGEMAGSVLFYPPNTDVYGGLLKPFPWAEIRLLAVAPSHRRKGVANALLEACEKKSRELGCSYLGLHTDNSMEHAIKLYNKRGYVRFPDNDFYPVKDLHVMAFRKLV
ncbi:GNAT family N-acetyltransferase [Priestia aryabhattai]|uniref:GNAT family N-acetyltransferase n=1 Tax=Priestia megaterium TaxID=1404 RepID=UPI0039B886DA